MSTTEIKLYDIFRKDLKLSEFKSQNKEDLLKLEMQLTAKIEQSKYDLVKWFVGLFFALAMMIIGLYIKK